MGKLPKKQDVYDNLPRIRLADCHPELDELREMAQHNKEHASLDCQAGKCPICGYAIHQEMRGGRIVWLCSCRWFNKQGKDGK